RPAPQYLERLGDAYSFHVGDYQQALKAYNMALQLEGSNVNSGFLGRLARAYYLAGDSEQANRAIQAGSKINPNDPSLLVITGCVQWKQGNLQDARKSLRRALSVTGQGPNISNSAGFIYHYWGNASEVGHLISDLRSFQADDGLVN